MRNVVQKAKTLLFYARKYIRRWTRSFSTLVSQPYRNAVLRRLIQGRRILVLASGPSAVNLPKHIPKDVLIFACNTSPSLLLPTNRRDIALYIANRRIMQQPERLQEVASVLGKFSIEVFLFRALKFIKKQNQITTYKEVLLDRSVGGRDDYLLKKFLPKQTIHDFKKRNGRISPSTGVGLLQYALHYGAKEVYLIGVDLDGVPRISDNEGVVPYKGVHDELDHAVVRAAKEHFENVYVASERSPLISYFSYKNIQRESKNASSA